MKDDNDNDGYGDICIIYHHYLLMLVLSFILFHFIFMLLMTFCVAFKLCSLQLYCVVEG